jgi:hypothetical protein
MAGWIAPPEGPLTSPKPARSFHSPKTPDESTWGSPLRRRLTLTNGFRHATKNYPAHSPISTISEMCCVKNTQIAGAPRPG